MNSFENGAESSSAAGPNGSPAFPSTPGDPLVSGDEHASDPALAPADGRLDGHDPMIFVRQFITREQLEVRFDRSLFPKGRPLIAATPDDVNAVLAVEPLEICDLVDLMLIDCKREHYNFRKGDIDRATRQVIREESHQRRNTVIGPLLKGLSEPDRVKAQEQWFRVGALFEFDQLLANAILRHFIWQVFQKVLGRPLVHHLMPVVIDPIQGSGKTTFVTKFLGPLRELATGPTLLSEIADRRSGDIFRYPVVNVDDVERLPPALVPVLKSLLTAEHVRRRRLGTSMSFGIRQKATPIGTANTSIQELIEDDTGHRRFAELPFRNGNAAKGGDPEIWQIVNSTNFDVLWRSVDAFAGSPILDHLNDLVRHQARLALKNPLVEWLQGLDLQSEALLRITRPPGVQAQGLHNLYLAQRGTDISPIRFAEAMRRCFLDPDVPFGGKLKTDAGTFYRFKAPT